MRRSIAVVYLTCVGAGLLAVHAQMHKKPFASENSLVQVSGQSHFPPGCPPQQSGIDYMNSAVEPQVATDPTNPQHLIGVWQQDRWSNGGATATLTGVSFDGGRTWKQISARTGVCDGGSTTLASDPWVTISPNGVAYQSALGLTRTAGSTETAVLVSRSSDGGISWGDVTVVDSSKSDDKETITADPIDAHYVYAVWDRNGAAPNSLANWFSRSVDGGLTWEPAHPIYDPGPNNYASINQIVVLTDGTLLDVFLLTRGDSPTMIAAMRSTDRGATWSAPVAIAFESCNRCSGLEDAGRSPHGPWDSKFGCGFHLGYNLRRLGRRAIQRWTAGRRGACEIDRWWDHVVATRAGEPGSGSTSLQSCGRSGHAKYAFGAAGPRRHDIFRFSSGWRRREHVAYNLLADCFGRWRKHMAGNDGRGTVRHAQGATFRRRIFSWRLSRASRIR